MSDAHSAAEWKGVVRFTLRGGSTQAWTQAEQAVFRSLSKKRATTGTEQMGIFVVLVTGVWGWTT